MHGRFLHLIPPRFHPFRWFIFPWPATIAKNLLCLEGCPSGSFSREPASGGIIVDENKCIGCSYCKWNCPYDAPKINLQKGIIEKCDLCYRRLSEGLEPACTSACPTGALNYGHNPGHQPGQQAGMVSRQRSQSFSLVYRCCKQSAFKNYTGCRD